MSDYKELLNQEIVELAAKVEQATLPEELRSQLKKEVISLERSVELGNYDEKHEKVSRYIDWCLRIPFGKYTADNLDIEQAKKVFDQHHFGMEEVKNRFLEYLAVADLTPSLSRPSFSLSHQIQLESSSHGIFFP